MNGAKELQRAAAAHRGTRDRLSLAIVEAHRDGMSLRAIAKLADVSHETVRRIVASED